MAHHGTFLDWLQGQHARLYTRRCADWRTCPCGPGARWHDGRLTWYGRWRFTGPPWRRHGQA